MLFQPREVLLERALDLLFHVDLHDAVALIERLVVERGLDVEVRHLAEGEERFDVVVVDPPAFARNRREIEGAERGYVELNRRALGIVSEGGVLVSASCSYNVRSAEFVKFLASASRLAGRDAWLEELRGASPDHPQLLAVPESAYLKCAFLRVP